MSICKQTVIHFCILIRLMYSMMMFNTIQELLLQDYKHGFKVDRIIGYRREIAIFPNKNMKKSNKKYKNECVSSFLKRYSQYLKSTSVFNICDSNDGEAVISIQTAYPHHHHWMRMARRSNGMSPGRTGKVTLLLSC